jgi:hypothetical protein
MLMPLCRALYLLTLVTLCSAQPAAAESWRIDGVERIVAIGDVHGAQDELAEILAAVGLIDAERRWSGGRTHLVATGDLLDRGDFGRQVMDMLMRLEQEAAAAGGAVHLVLGNHEVMNLSSDLRYVSAGDYLQFGTEAVGGQPPGYFERREALAPDGPYGEWLLGRPVALVINDLLFVHGGVSGLLEGLSLEQINAAAASDLRRFLTGWQTLVEAGQLGELDDFGLIRSKAASLASGEADGALQAAAADIGAALEGLPFHPDGPLWYRGTALCHAYAEAPTTSKVLGQLGVRGVVIGHTVTQDRRISSRLAGKVFRIDTGMNRVAYGGIPSALVIEGGQLTAHYAGEPGGAPRAEPSREWARPYGMADAELEQFLASADVVQSESHASGIRRLTLEQGDRRIQALFNSADSSPGLQQARRWKRAAERANRHVYELAAYRLDRILGLELVPVAVPRVIDGEAGTVQYWMPDTVSEDQRRRESIPISGYCSLTPQFKLMNVFDLLVLNVGRDEQSIRYTRDGQLWLLGHSRAFGTGRGTLRGADIELTAELSAMLDRVTPENLESLRQWLHPRQVEALVSRARWLQKQ